MRIGEGIEVRIDEGVEGRVGEGIDGGRVGEGIEGRIGERIEERSGEGLEETSDESIKCICACNVEKGEMVCCDVCEGWTHLRCIGMKEGVGGMEGKEFVCYFCVSACLLAMRRDVEGLRKELKETREENGRLRSVLEQERSERVRVAQKEVKENMPECERVAATGDRLAESMAAGEGEQQTDNQWRQTSGVEQSKGQKGRYTYKPMNGWKEGKRSMKGIPGMRKVWGTQKKESCNDVAKEMVRVVGRVGSQFSVVKQLDKSNEKNRWWFIVKAPEKSLQDVDKKWKHEHWHWQKVRVGGSGFLDVGPVSIRHR